MSRERRLLALLLAFGAVAALGWWMCGDQERAGRAARDVTAPGPSLAPSAPATARPNVLWILLDACRVDHLSAYGYARRTSPELERLAARGARFDNHWAQGPNTLLSVGSYMTGRHFPAFYQDSRHLEMSFLKRPAPDEKLISTLLGAASYDTAMFSASPWYSPDSRLAKSFGEFQRLVYGAGAPTASYVARNPQLFRWLERRRAAPFFLYVHLLDTHEPRYDNNTRPTWLDPAFDATRDAELRQWPDGPFSEADQRHLTDLYDGGVAYADSVVGELLAKLERLGLTENTLVIVSADHGELLAEDGATLGHPGELSYDELLRTPLIVAGPGIPAGRRVSIATENADIVPTLVELLGLSVKARFDGRSLLPALRSDEPAALHVPVVARSMAFLTQTRPNSLLIYDDVKLDVSALAPEELSGHGLPMRPREQLWVMPDRIGVRKAAQVPTERLEQMRALIAGPIEQAWREHASQPVEMPAYFETMQGGTVTPNAESEALDFSDGRWTRKRARTVLRSGESALLITDPQREKAPGMVMGVGVPNGTYRVSLYTTTEPAKGSGRGVSFRFLKYPEEKDFRLFQLAPDASGEVTTAWLELGTYTVKDGNFVYWIESGRPEDLSVVGSFRFTRADATAAVPSEQELRDELQRLKATGYVQ